MLDLLADADYSYSSATRSFIWHPLYLLAHQLDPQNRPVTLVGCQNDYTRDITIP